MTYYEKLNADMKQAMKDKDKQKLGTLRLIITDLKNEQIKLTKQELTKEEEEVVLNRYLKKLDKEIESYIEVNKTTEKQETEKALVLSYLPTKLSEEEIVVIIKETIIEVQATSKKEIGKLMATLKSKFDNNADMSFVSKTVKELLS